MPPKKEVNDLQVSVSDLIAKVDNLTKIVNSKQIAELNESIINLSEKLNSLTKSANDYHETVMLDIASIRDGILNNLIDGRKNKQKR